MIVLYKLLHGSHYLDRIGFGCLFVGLDKFVELLGDMCHVNSTKMEPTLRCDVHLKFRDGLELNSLILVPKKIKNGKFNKISAFVYFNNLFRVGHNTFSV